MEALYKRVEIRLGPVSSKNEIIFSEIQLRSKGDIRLGDYQEEVASKFGLTVVSLPIRMA